MMKAEIPAVKPMGPPQDPALQGLAHALRRTLHGLASRGLLLGLCTVFAGLAVWAHFARVDDVARGDGRIVPSGRMLVFHHLEGGVVNAIHV